MNIVGITGGIGSGKTTITDYFKTLGIEVVDSDIIARQVVEPGTTGLESIIKRFGNNILTQEGFLDRAQLREVIFSTPSEKDWLESVLHPIIRQQTLKELNESNSTYTILSSPLLLETNTQELVDRILVIDIPEEIQISRTCQRDSASQIQTKKIIESQISRAEKLKLADDVIDNSGTIESSYSQVDNLHQRYLKLAQSNSI